MFDFVKVVVMLNIMKRSFEVYLLFGMDWVDIVVEYLKSFWLEILFIILLVNGFLVLVVKNKSENSKR